MGTLKKRIEDPREIADPNVVKVVTDRAGNAIYFSRSPIPYVRDARRSAALLQTHRSVCLPARFPAGLSGSARGPARAGRALEQLRALENGFKIRVVETEYESLGVDTPEDLERVSELFEATFEMREVNESMAKYIFVTGGVVSSLGKGIAAAIHRLPARKPRPQGHAAEIRSLSERRSRAP